MKLSMNDLKNRFNKETILPWVEVHKRQIAVGGILVCLVIILLATFWDGGKKGSAGEGNGSSIQTAVADAGQESQEAEEPEELPNDLEQDAYPEINALMENYYSCMAAGDVDGIRALVDVLSEEEQSYIESLKTLIEGYNNIRCYTKRGMEEGSYLVFVRYDLRFVVADTMAPGVEGYYVKTNDSGNYYIFLDTPDDALLNYVNEIVQDADVQALYQEVQAEFADAQAADEKLAECASKLEQLKNGEEEEGTEETPAEGEETPAEEGGETEPEAPAEETPEEQPAENTGTSSEEGTPVNRETRFKESTNIRAERSTDSERLALGYQGESVTQVMEYSDGWSKIIYNGKEGYCKTEFLEGQSGTGSESTGSTSSGSGEGTAVNKETRFKESTNVRAERSTDSERLALGYQGEAVTRVTDYSDGWSKIIYKGKEGYCKTEYLE